MKDQSQKNYMQSPIAEVTITANSIELDIDKNFIIPNMNGEIAILLRKPEAKQLVTMLNEFLRYQNGNGPKDEDPNKVLLNKLIQQNRDGWEKLISFGRDLIKDNKHAKDDADHIGVYLESKIFCVMEQAFLDASLSHLSKTETARIQKQEFISYFVSQLKARSEKQLKSEAK